MWHFKQRSKSFGKNKESWFLFFSSLSRIVFLFSPPFIYFTCWTKILNLFTQWLKSQSKCCTNHSAGSASKTSLLLRFEVIKQVLIQGLFLSYFFFKPWLSRLFSQPVLTLLTVNIFCFSLGKWNPGRYPNSAKWTWGPEFKEERVQDFRQLSDILCYDFKIDHQPRGRQGFWVSAPFPAKYHCF